MLPHEMSTEGALDPHRGRDVPSRVLAALDLELCQEEFSLQQHPFLQLGSRQGLDALGVQSSSVDAQLHWPPRGVLRIHEEPPLHRLRRGHDGNDVAEGGPRPQPVERPHAAHDVAGRVHR